MTRLDEILAGAGSLLITGHVRPDGDCVGACLAAAAYAASLDPDRKITVCLEPFPDSFGFLPGAGAAVRETSDDFDLALALDASTFERLTPPVRDAFQRAKRSFCIDHHVTNTRFAQETYVESDASSTCEVLFYLMEEKRITQEIASALYLGIVHDTGVFKHSNTTERTMRAAGRLVTLGAQPSHIIDETFYRKSFRQNRLLGQALLQAQLEREGQIIHSYISLQQLLAEGGNSQDIEGIIDQLRVTGGVRVAVFLYELEPGQWKASLRSNDETDVSAVCAVFGGGGHVRAAGCSLTGTLAQVREKLLEAVGQALIGG